MKQVSRLLRVKLNKYFMISFSHFDLIAASLTYFTFLCNSKYLGFETKFSGSSITAASALIWTSASAIFSHKLQTALLVAVELVYRFVRNETW